MTRAQASLLLLKAGAIWGIGFIAQSTAMENIGPLWFVALPFSLLEKARAAQPVRPAHIAGFALTGLALFSGNTLQQFGLLTTSVTNSGFLTGLYVVFTPILTLVLLRRQPHWVIWPAATLAAFSTFLLSGGALSALTFGETISPMGYAGCAIIFAAMLAAELVPGLARTRSAGRPVEV